VSISIRNPQYQKVVVLLTTLNGPTSMIPISSSL
jgi:hypothetical protein